MPEKRRGNPKWQKGVSGNPGGRPKEVVEVIALARALTPAAIERLAQIIQRGNDQAAVAAIKVAMDRGWGLAPATVKVEGEVVHHVKRIQIED